MSALCPWCEAPRQEGPRCPRCGAIYAKAEALKAGIDPVPAAPSAWQGGASDLALERRLRLFAIPSALALAALFHASHLGHFFQRVFLSMMVHELGHAVTAWLCGFAAFPLPWRTPIAATRGPLVPLAVAAAGLWLVLRSRQLGERRGVIAGAALLVVQLAGTLLLSARTAQMLITFGGDGGAMVLGTLLMATFFFGRDTQLYQGMVRWGLLVIGAAAFVDTFATWWIARRDDDVIPFGEIEGVGLSDPSKLTDVYGWTVRSLIARYVTLGVLCLTTLTLVWLWGIWRARRELVTSRRKISDAV